METFTFWTILFVLALVLLLEGASLSPPGRFHKAMVGGALSSGDPGAGTGRRGLPLRPRTDLLAGSPRLLSRSPLMTADLRGSLRHDGISFPSPVRDPER